MTRFWKVYTTANLLAVAVMIGVYIWAFFDIHERFDYAIISQVLPIIMMVVRRAFSRDDQLTGKQEELCNLVFGMPRGG